jgi:hypothetical protein
LAVQLYQEERLDYRGQLESRISADDSVRVYVDEERPPPEQEPSTSNDIREETSPTSKLRRNYCNVFTIAFACCLVGTTIGLALAGRGRVREHKFTGRVDAGDIASPPSPQSINHQNSTFLPTTASPSAAQSCSKDLSLVWAGKYSNASSNNLVVASGAYYNDSLQTLGVFAKYDVFDDKWTIHTFVLSETGIEVRFSQELDYLMQVQSLAVSFDGRTLVMGVSSYYTAGIGGGAFMIFQRLDPDWNLRWTRVHVADTGGGDFGTVFDVAVNDNGSVIAVSAARSFEGEINALVIVYKVMENGLEQMGKSFLKDTLTVVELSGDGTRLFMCMATLKQSSRINIYDFSFRDGWTSSGNPFSEGKFPTLQVSRDGNILVVSGGDSSYSEKVYALIDQKWETLDFVSFSSGEVPSNYKSTLSNDGYDLFLSGWLETEGQLQKMFVGELYRRGSNGFESISSLTFPVLHYVDRIFFNEEATQLVIPTDLLLLAFELTCAPVRTEVPPTDSPLYPTMTPSPTVCMTAFEPGRHFNLSAVLGDNMLVDNSFTRISHDGSTMVVVYSLDQNVSFRVATFQLSLDGVLTSNDEMITGYRLNTTSLSGDGSTLLLGVNSYAQKVQNEGAVGGALLVYRRGESLWKLHGLVETGGGEYGAVFDVTSSYDGRVVAFSASTIDGDSYVDVYAVLNQTGVTSINKQGSSGGEANYDVPGTLGWGSVNRSSGGETKGENLNAMLLSVTLSGSGKRLFISTRGTIRSLDFAGRCACWNQVGNIFTYESGTKIQVSFDGNVVLPTHTQSSVLAYEFSGGEWGFVNQGGSDSTETQIALSSDGQSFLRASSSGNQNSEVGVQLFKKQANGPSWSELPASSLMSLSRPLLMGATIMLADYGNVIVAWDDVVTVYQSPCA